MQESLGGLSCSSAQAVLNDNIIRPPRPAGKALVECHDAVSRRLEAEAAKSGAAPPAMVGYEDIGEAAFGALGRRIVSGVMYTELMGTCALLFILEVRPGAYRNDQRFRGVVVRDHQ